MSWRAGELRNADYGVGCGVRGINVPSGSGCCACQVMSEGRDFAVDGWAGISLLSRLCVSAGVPKGMYAFVLFLLLCFY